MAKIRITCSDNEIINTQGRLTFESVKDIDGNIKTVGQLAIHEYIEDIEKIETARYLLEGIDVFREVFGSNDFNILYEFELDEEYEIVVKEEFLTEKEIQAIKSKEYEEEDSLQWDGEKAWK